MNHNFVIHVDGRITEYQPHDKKYTLNELQEAVNGPIEFVYLDDGRVMVVNEEGKIWGLNVNKEASKLILHHTNRYDLIVGDVLITKMDFIE